MSFVDPKKQEINFKLVYYGPGLAGKTANMQYIYESTLPEYRSRMISMAMEPEKDRSLFFDLLTAVPIEIRGLRCRFHLYTLPGPVFYDESRTRCLRGADGIIFVADSQKDRAETNVELIESLETHLAVSGYMLEKVPLVLQYNKRDLPDLLSVEEIDAMLNPGGRPSFPAIARTGVGVFDTLNAIVQQVVADTRRGE